MSKLSTPKVAAKKARGAGGKIAAKVAVAKARTSRATHRRTNSKVVVEKARGARGKIAAKVAVAKARTSRATHRRTNSKVVAEKADVQRKTAPQVAAGELLDTRRIAAQFEKFRELKCRTHCTPLFKRTWLRRASCMSAPGALSDPS